MLFAIFSNNIYEIWSDCSLEGLEATKIEYNDSLLSLVGADVVRVHGIGRDTNGFDLRRPKASVYIASTGPVPVFCHVVIVSHAFNAERRSHGTFRGLPRKFRHRSTTRSYEMYRLLYAFS